VEITLYLYGDEITWQSQLRVISLGQAGSPPPENFEILHCEGKIHAWGEGSPYFSKT